MAKGQQVHRDKVSVEGTVFVRDSDGNRSAVGDAEVRLTGKSTFETKTDEKGEFVIPDVPRGTYAVEAAATGLKATATVRVETDEVQLALELKPASVTTSVVVTADQPDTRGPAPSETISDSTLRNAPNVNERFEGSLPLVPGVVRGPDGHVNLKGTRNTQSGALVNSANVTDPVTGSPAINLPVDVVASVQVISNPYDPEYGRFTGAISTVATKTDDYEKFHFSFQNFIPRLRDEGGSIRGIDAATPRMTFTGPLLKDKIAITQSFEYRFVQTPVNSLPPFHRDTELESFDSYTQLDFTISSKQTANVSVAVYPQRLNYLGLNTFTLRSDFVNDKSANSRLHITAPSNSGAQTAHPLVDGPSRQSLRPEAEEWDSFQEMYLASRPKFIAMAQRILRNREDAEDAVQDALLSAYLHFRGFEGRAAVKTWFTRIVLNASLMIRRKRKAFIFESGETLQPRLNAIPDAKPDPEKQCAHAEHAELIESLIGELSPAFREALVMTYFHELTARQAGGLLGVSNSNFKLRVFRAKKRLADRARRLMSLKSVA